MSTLPGAGDEPPPIYSLLPSSASPAPQSHLSRLQSSFPSPLSDTARLPPLPQLPPSRSQLPERNASLATLPPPPPSPPPVVEETPAGCPDPPSAPSSSRPSILTRLSRKRRPTPAEEARLAAEREAAEKEARQRTAEEQARVLAQKEKTRQDTREWVLNTLRALLSLDISSEDECRSVLRNCAEVCTRRNIDFPALLQEPVMVDHLPVYWAIVKRSGMQQREGTDPQALALTLVDFSRPLQSATVMGARNACVTVSENALFQRLCKRFKEFSRTTDTDMMLLSGSEVEDNIVVEELRDDPRAFVVHFELARFRLRMRVAKRVCAEFVARDRMWNITFSANHGDVSGIYRAWKITLRLGEHSPPAPVDAQLVITDNSSEPGEPDISIPFKAEERMLGHEKSESISIVLGRSATGTDLQDGCVLLRRSDRLPFVDSILASLHTLMR
ncbi:hypothetical protein BC826DRAFT_914600 [Russula brevipes]|nr:hypothetical protein BC826DRAFT_914600 [Russula brevipes]